MDLTTNGLKKPTAADVVSALRDAIRTNADKVEAILSGTVPFAETPWITPTLVNGWTGQVRYRKHLGALEFTGYVSYAGNPPGTVAFVIAAAASRPAFPKKVTKMGERGTGQAYAILDIYTNGEVSPGMTGGSGTGITIYLDGIRVPLTI